MIFELISLNIPFIVILDNSNDYFSNMGKKFCAELKTMRLLYYDPKSAIKFVNNLKNNKNVEFFNPPETENGFYIETGWTSINNKIKVPSKNSMWTVKGNNVLSENQSVVLEWNNGDGIIFKKKMDFDNKYLL